MDDIYSIITNGIKKHHGFDDIRLIAYLDSLKPAVRHLRQAYRKYPVSVNYADTEIQSAYLLAYFPHYYQLIYKLIIENFPTIFENQKIVYLSFFGAGPGPEVYGAIKYIKNNCPSVKEINVHIFDINASTWNYSHEILLNQIFETVIPKHIQIKVNSYNFDLTEPISKDELTHIESSGLVILQNCLNEIAPEHAAHVKSNLKQVFERIPTEAAMLLVDLTGGTNATTYFMQDIERIIANEFKAKKLFSINDNALSATLQSVHHLPSPLVKKHLLNGEDGLIPRKWLKYNYSFIRKSVSQSAKEPAYAGISALYTPLSLSFSDANDFLHSKSFIGIDFGTSTTVVSMASVQEGKIVTKAITITQKDENGFKAYKPLLQSTIAYIPGKILVGDYAYLMKGELQRNIDLWYGFKLELGIQNRKEYPNSKLFNNKDFPIKNSLDATKLFFKYLKKQIDNHICSQKYPVDTAIAVSIPASFGENERNDLLQCLNEANIAVGANPFIDEPIAAVLNYIFESHAKPCDEETKTMLVMDCGAGTFDITILQLKTENGKYSSKCLSVTRNGNIGGNLIDSMIADHVLWSQWVAQHPGHNDLTVTNKAKVKYALAEIAEKLKIKLCKSIDVFPFNEFKLPAIALSDTEVMLPHQIFNISGKPYTFTSPHLRYSDFVKIISNYTSFNKINNPSSVGASINLALNKAGFKKDQISDLLLTGGAMRNPYLIALIAGSFKNTNIILPDNIQEHVAKGAAIHALALNCFGTNLIATIISDDIIVKDDKDTIILFSAGTEIPTVEKRFKIKTQPHACGKIKIPVYSQQQPLKLICFECLPDKTYEIICSVNPEKWLEAETFYNGSEIDTILEPCLTTHSEDVVFFDLMV